MLPTFFQQLNRRIKCCWAQVHVPLRHRKILMPYEFLNGARRCATHRQMRTERVTEDVHPFMHIRPPSRSLHPVLHLLPGQRRPVRLPS